MRNTGILYNGESKTYAMPEPVCNTDSDWARDRDKRWSTSSFVVVLCGGAGSGKTRKPDIDALSMTEVVYIAFS